LFAASLSTGSDDRPHLVPWIAWYEGNEITHDNHVPSTKGSKRFLCIYARILKSIRATPTDRVLKGKHPMISTGEAPGDKRKIKKPPEKPG
jgi:hypothetical protein